MQRLAHARRLRARNELAEQDDALGVGRPLRRLLAERRVERIDERFWGRGHRGLLPCVHRRPPLERSHVRFVPKADICSAQKDVLIRSPRRRGQAPRDDPTSRECASDLRPQTLSTTLPSVSPFSTYSCAERTSWKSNTLLILGLTLPASIFERGTSLTNRCEGIEQVPGGA